MEQLKKTYAIIQHTENGDFDYTDRLTLEEAIDELTDELFEGPSGELSYEETLAQVRSTLVYYTEEEVIEAHKDGHGWPVKFGFIEKE